VQRARAVGVQADEVTVGTLLKALAAEGRADEAFSVYTQVSTLSPPYLSLK
jgi:pentatricopeptide repeat protein